MYLTPARYRTLNTGTDLTAVTDASIAASLETASSLVNAFCGVPMTPAAHDFRGGSVTAEQHVWPLPDMTFGARGGRRVYPLHAPLATVTSFVVKFTDTYQVEVLAANLYVNKIENWAEVVSVAAVVSGVYPVGINFGLYTPVAEVGYTYGWSLLATLDPLELVGTGVYQAHNQFWFASPTPLVYVGGTLQTSGYTVDRYEGTVTFSSAPSASAVVTATYGYPLPGPIAQATGILGSRLVAEANLVAAGMGSLTELTVAEVTLRRGGRYGSTTATASLMDGFAEALLAPYRYLTVR